MHPDALARYAGTPVLAPDLQSGEAAAHRSPLPTRASVISGVSVVIPNFNYGRYLAEAVQSALDLEWPDVQVIVVDDGSTDDSLEVLASFGDRISVMTQENSGPRVACNRGFARSSGDMVIFLDSDDVLEPTIMSEVDAVWRDGVSKVQVQMTRVDGHGTASGAPFPRFRAAPAPERIRHWMTTTAAYPTPPGSGNVYAREFLDRLFPLDDRCGDATDSACLAAAPFLGDVLTIPKPLVRYRVHADNRSSLGVDPDRFRRQIERAQQRQQFARTLSGHSRNHHDGVMIPLRRGRHLLQMRAAERRLGSGPAPLRGDGRARIGLDAVLGVFSPGPETVAHRLAVSLWTLTTLIAPATVARWLIGRRFH